MDFLRDPLWQFIGVVFTVILGLLAIIVSIVIAGKQEKRKAIFYDVLSNTSLSSFKISNKLSMSIIFGRKRLEDVNLVYLEVWNSGNAEILPSDFYTPIKFEFGEKANVLEAIVLGTRPETIKNNVSINYEQNYLAIQPMLLNGKDAITLKILVSQYTGKTNVDARIAGIKQIKALGDIEANGIEYFKSFGLGLKGFLNETHAFISMLSFMVIMGLIIFVGNKIGITTMENILSKIFVVFMLAAGPFIDYFLIEMLVTRGLAAKKLRYKRWHVRLIAATLPFIILCLFLPIIYFILISK